MKNLFQGLYSVIFAIMAICHLSVLTLQASQKDGLSPRLDRRLMGVGLDVQGTEVDQIFYESLIREVLASDSEYTNPIYLHSNDDLTVDSNPISNGDGSSTDIYFTSSCEDETLLEEVITYISASSPKITSPLLHFTNHSETVDSNNIWPNQKLTLESNFDQVSLIPRVNLPNEDFQTEPGGFLYDNDGFENFPWLSLRLSHVTEIIWEMEPEENLIPWSMNWQFLVLNNEEQVETNYAGDENTKLNTPKVMDIQSSGQEANNETTFANTNLLSGLNTSPTVSHSNFDSIELGRILRAESGGDIDLGKLTFEDPTETNDYLSANWGYTLYW